MDVAKWMIILAGLTLAAMPSAASAQQSIGVTVRIAPRVAQPDLMDAASTSSLGAARVPAGWGWSVSRGTGGGAGSHPAAARVSAVDSIESAPRLDAVAGREQEVVTWTFVPL